MLKTEPRQSKSPLRRQAMFSPQECHIFHMLEWTIFDETICQNRFNPRYCYSIPLLKGIFSNIHKKLETSQIYNKSEMDKL